MLANGFIYQNREIKWQQIQMALQYVGKFAKLKEIQYLTGNFAYI